MLPNWIIEDILHRITSPDNRLSATYRMWLYDHWNQIDNSDQDNIKKRLGIKDEPKPGKLEPIRTYEKIIIHWSASTHGNAAHIRQWHLERPDPFDDIGYHFVISDQNTVETGRAITEPGAHTIGQNLNSVGICYIGSPDMQPIYKRPIAWRLLSDLVASLLVTYKLNPDDVYGHKNFANTLCPGFNIEILRNVLKDTKSKTDRKGGDANPEKKNIDLLSEKKHSSNTKHF